MVALLIYLPMWFIAIYYYVNIGNTHERDKNRVIRLTNIVTYMATLVVWNIMNYSCCIMMYRQLKQLSP